jgi:hypothetical protein
MPIHCRNEGISNPLMLESRMWQTTVQLSFVFILVQQASLFFFIFCTTRISRVCEPQAPAFVSSCIWFFIIGDADTMGNEVISHELGLVDDAGRELWDGVGPSYIQWR